MHLVALFVHPVYCSNDFYAQILAPVGLKKYSRSSQLVPSRSPASEPPPRISATTETTLRFLRTCLIDLQFASLDVQAVKFSNCPSPIVTVGAILSLEVGQVNEACCSKVVRR